MDISIPDRLQKHELVFYLHQLGMTHAQIGKVMGIHPSTVGLKLMSRRASFERRTSVFLRLIRSHESNGAIGFDPDKVGAVVTQCPKLVMLLRELSQ